MLIDNFDEKYTYELDLEFKKPSCKSPSSPSVPENLNGSVIKYTLTRSSVDFTFPEFISGPDCCEVSYHYQVDDRKGWLVVKNWDSLRRTFTFEYSQDLEPLNNDALQDSQEF